VHENWKTELPRCLHFIVCVYGFQWGDWSLVVFVSSKERFARGGWDGAWVMNVRSASLIFMLAKRRQKRDPWIKIYAVANWRWTRGIVFRGVVDDRGTRLTR